MRKQVSGVSKCQCPLRQKRTVSFRNVKGFFRFFNYIKYLRFYGRGCFFR